MEKQPTEMSPENKPQKEEIRKATLARISLWCALGGFGYFFIFLILTNVAVGIAASLFWYDFGHYLESSFVLIFIPFLVAELAAFICGFAGIIQITLSKKHLKGYSYCLLGIFFPLLTISIKIPNYLRYQEREKQVPAKQNLMAIYAAYQAYHSDYGTYPSEPAIKIGDVEHNCFSVAKWNPEWSIKNGRYNYNCMNTEIYKPDKFHNNTSCPSGIITSATKDSFTVAACGNMDADPAIDVWTINDAKQLRNVVDDVKQ